MKSPRQAAREQAPVGTAPRVAIMGWYGNRNAGDEVLLSAIVRQVRHHRPDARITVFSDKPDYTKARHELDACVSLAGSWGDTFSRPIAWRLGKQLLPGLATLARSEIAIIGGGGLLADHDPRTIRGWCHRINLSRRLAKRAVCYGIGVEPLEHAASRELARQALAPLPVVICRDAESVAELERCGLSHNIVLGADPVFALQSGPDAAVPSRLPSQYESMLNGSVLVCPVHRFQGEHLEAYGKLLVEAATEAITASGARGIALGLMFPPDGKLRPWFQALPGYLGEVPLHEFSAESMLRAFALPAMVVSSRLHGVILASLSKQRQLPVIYDIKVESCVKRLGMSELCLEFGDGSVWRDTRTPYDDVVAKVARAATDEGRPSASKLNALVARARSQAELLWGDA